MRLDGELFSFLIVVALLGTRSRKSVLDIAKSWGGLGNRKPLLNNILQWPGAILPKLPPEAPGDEQTDEPEEKHCPMT